MSGQARKLKIGLFVVVSLLVAVATVIWVGASRYFEVSQTAVAYFTESVQGLEADSPVKFRGVSVGRVEAIRMAPDGRLIEVVLSLARNFKLTDDLGIKMNLLGLTGQKYLEMDTFKSDQAGEIIDLDFTPRYTVIKTYASDIREIGTALEKIFQKINAIDVDRISAHLLKVTARMDKIMQDPRLDNLGGDTAETIKEIRDTARKLNEEMSKVQLGKNLTRVLEKTSELLDESTEAVRSIDRAITRADNNVNRLTQKLDRSADNLIEFTRMIKVKPSSIIFGADEKEKAGQKR